MGAEQEVFVGDHLVGDWVTAGENAINVVRVIAEGTLERDGPGVIEGREQRPALIGGGRYRAVRGDDYDAGVPPHRDGSEVVDGGNAVRQKAANF